MDTLLQVSASTASWHDRRKHIAKSGSFLSMVLSRSVAVAWLNFEAWN